MAAERFPKSLIKQMGGGGCLSTAITSVQLIQCQHLTIGHNSHFRYFVKNRPKVDFNTPSERPFSKLSEKFNHKINVIGPSKLKLWPLKDTVFNA